MKFANGDRVKVVGDYVYEDWIGVVESVNDDPGDDEPYDVYFEFIDGFAFFSEDALELIEEVD